MKKILCLLLSVLMLVSLCACASSDNTSSQADESKTVPADSDSAESSEKDESKPEESEPIYPDEPVINGSKISEYVVVYRETVDCPKYKAVALELIDLVKETYGIELDIRSERLVEKEKEILVGTAVNRQICSDNSADYGYGGYKMVVSGNKVLFASSYANGAYFAYEEFKKLLTSGNEITDTTAEGSKNVVKVACVGDSIIQGINSADNINRTYPSYLQGLLGYDYFVLNAGISGYSIIKTDPYAYCKSTQYTTAKSFVPDVVLFSLGTNDANPSPTQAYKDWSAPGRKDLFLESARELLDSFYDVNPDVQIILSYSCALNKNGGNKWDADGWNKNIVTYVRPLLEQIANTYMLYTVDMWPWSQEHPEYFTDGLHPKDETYLPYAEFVYENIKDEIKKPGKRFVIAENC